MSEWTREAVEVLLDVYKNHEVLYNSRNTSYQNKHSRKDALDKVTVEVKKVRPGTTVEDIKKKMMSLRTHFGQEMQKMQRSRRSGAASGSVYTPSVWWFPLMMFLRDHIQARKGENSLPSSLPCQLVLSDNAIVQVSYVNFKM